MNNKEHIYTEFAKSHEVSFSESKEEVWEKLSMKAGIESKGRITSKNKDEIWEQLPQKADIESSKKIPGLNKYTYLAAAVFLTLVSLISFARFYKAEIHCPAGEHQAVDLACNSTVTLNAGSTLSYYPLWWEISRICKLSGEAFFEVTPGRSFSIRSDKGMTKVLGTSFNIYARNNSYKVYCATGKVKVRTALGEETILLPGQLVNKTGNKIQKYENVKMEKIVGWKNKSLTYTAEPIKNVLEEIERQYNITIEYKFPLDNIISVSFNLNNIDTSLSIVCKPFNISFIKVSNQKYKLIKN